LFSGASSAAQRSRRVASATEATVAAANQASPRVKSG
jgi:hypothetical protein